MNKRYHLLVENAKPDSSFLTPGITITLVDTKDFYPVFEVRTLHQYQSSIMEIVMAQYKDEVKCYVLPEMNKLEKICN